MRLAFAALAALLVSLASATDWAQSGFNESRAGLTPDAGPVARPVRPLWNATIESTLPEESSPLIINGRLWAAASWGLLQVLNATDGTPLFNVSVSPLSDCSGISYDPASNTVIAFDYYHQGGIVAVDGDSGAPKWTVPRDGSVIFAMLAEGKILGRNDTHWMAYDAGTGALSWAVPKPSTFYYRAAAGEGKFFAGSGYPTSFRLYWIANGSMVWEAQIPYFNDQAYAGGKFFLTSCWAHSTHTVFAYFASNGTLAWRNTPAEGCAHIGGFYGNSVIVQNAGINSVAIAYDMDSGVQRWNAMLNRHSLTKMSIASNGLYYVCDTNGGLSAYPAGGGQQLWTYALSCTNQRGSAIADGTLFSANANRLFAFNDSAAPTTPTPTPAPTPLPSPTPPPPAPPSSPTPSTPPAPPPGPPSSPTPSLQPTPTPPAVPTPASTPSGPAPEEPLEPSLAGQFNWRSLSLGGDVSDEDRARIVKRLRDLGEDPSDEEAVLREYERLKSEKKEQEAASVVSKFSRMLSASASGVSGRYAWLAFAALIAVVAIAFYYSSDLRRRPPSAGPASEKLAELRQQMQ